MAGTFLGGGGYDGYGAKKNTGAKSQGTVAPGTRTPGGDARRRIEGTRSFTTIEDEAHINAPGGGSGSAVNTNRGGNHPVTPKKTKKNPVKLSANAEVLRKPLGGASTVGYGIGGHAPSRGQGGR